MNEPSLICVCEIKQAIGILQESQECIASHVRVSLCSTTLIIPPSVSGGERKQDTLHEPGDSAELWRLEYMINEENLL